PWQTTFTFKPHHKWSLGNPYRLKHYIDLLVHSRKAPWPLDIFSYGNIVRQWLVRLLPRTCSTPSPNHGGGRSSNCWRAAERWQSGLWSWRWEFRNRPSRSTSP